MRTTKLDPSHREVFAKAIWRLRHQAETLERLMRSADPKKLAEVCEMLHVTAEQLLRVHSELESRTDSRGVRRAESSKP